LFYSRLLAKYLRVARIRSLGLGRAIGSLTHIKNAFAYLGRDERGFYAIVAICSYLGCTPRLDANELASPCHGSRLARDRLFPRRQRARWVAPFFVVDDFRCDVR
jgi:hypothetical protein